MQTRLALIPTRPSHAPETVRQTEMAVAYMLNTFFDLELYFSFPSFEIWNEDDNRQGIISEVGYAG